MNRFVSHGLAGAGLALALAVSPVTAPSARAEVTTVITVGDGCCWHPYPYHHGYYPGWGRPVYVVPPPVVYAPPPAVYAAPPPVAYGAPASGMVNAAPASPVFVDGQGRACREYQTSVVIGGASRPAYGTACQQPDGTWRVVQ